MSRAPKVKKTMLNVPPAAKNFVDNTQMAYGEKTAMKKFLQLDLDVFSSTNRLNEDVRTGIGVPNNMRSTRELVQEMYALTGDPDLARLLS